MCRGVSPTPVSASTPLFGTRSRTAPGALSARARWSGHSERAECNGTLPMTTASPPASSLTLRPRLVRDGSSPGNCCELVRAEPWATTGPPPGDYPRSNWREFDASGPDRGGRGRFGQLASTSRQIVPPRPRRTRTYVRSQPETRPNCAFGTSAGDLGGTGPEPGPCETW